MLVLGVETSCDETGIALLDSAAGLRSHGLYSQIDLHAEYGGVVPELASRDHIRRIVPLIRRVVAEGKTELSELDAVAFTRGPGLAGALLVGASVAVSLAYALKIPALGVHHLEGHLLAPLLDSDPPDFPFVALLVSGGHSQLMAVEGVGRYTLLGDTLDDAAGEAFDKTAQLLGLGYPGGPAIAKVAEMGTPGRFKLPRPLLHSGDLNFSFSGLKTAVMTLIKNTPLTATTRADIALEFQSAVVDVLSNKSLAALKHAGMKRLVVAGGVGANRALRSELASRTGRVGAQIYTPRPEFCTDNGAMIALAGMLRLEAGEAPNLDFDIKPRWDLCDVGLAI